MRRHPAVSLGVAVAALLLFQTGSLEAQGAWRFESVDRTSRSVAVSDDPLFYPSGVAIDPAGAVWIADTANHVIRKMGPSGTMEVVAGAIGIEGAVDGSAEDARFSYPQGLTFDAAGNLYIADSGNGVIRRMSPGGQVEVWAGQVGARGSVDDRRLESMFITPIALAWDLTGELWIADYSAHTIRRISTDGDVDTISGIAGTPGFVDGPGEKAKFWYPSGIDVDAQGRLWIADEGNGAIRVVTRDGFTETFAGLSGENGHRDGPRDVAGFDHPSDLVIRDDGVIFVSDFWSHTIRMIEGESVTTIAGSPGLPGDSDGVGAEVRFDHPVAIAIHPDGTLFVTDMLNHAVREGVGGDFGPVRRRPVGR